MNIRSLSEPGTRQQVKDLCILLDENSLDEIAKNLNYKVLVKIVEITTPLNRRYFENFPVGHHYAILVYLDGDVRKLYYQGCLKLDQLFSNAPYLSYVVLHLLEDGIKGKYFSNYKELAAYYEDLHSKQINDEVFTFQVKEGSGAENYDNSRLKYVLKGVLNKKYNVFSWNCIHFVNYLKKNLGDINSCNII